MQKLSLNHSLLKKDQNPKINIKKIPKNLHQKQSILIVFKLLIWNFFIIVIIKCISLINAND